MMLQQLIGRKIKVRINDRDFSGKPLPNKFTYVVGICTFAGFNKNIGEYQVTVNRMPIFPIQFKDVEVID
jgi:hypothetical protein